VSSPLLVVVFLAAAGVIWVSGIGLSNATDALDARLGLGSAFGGLVLLAIATNLPEIAITVTAAASGNLELAVGNLVGGIAIQTLVLALLDLRSRGRPLTHRVGSLTIVLEASIVIGVLIAVIMAAQLSPDTNVGGVSPGSIGVVLIWIGGLVVINRSRKGIPWQIEAPGADPGRSATDRAAGADPSPFTGRSTPWVVGVFVLAALLTLGAGVAIEESGSHLADEIGLSGAIFGATILAASTALPEISTGLASVKLGDHELAFADIFGGNAFLPVLFLLADVVSGQPALPTARAGDLWMAGLGVLLTTVYVAGLIIRPVRKRGPLGPDSWAALGLYAVGIVGLIAIS
jgi:cation:H+ antiporter